LLVKPHAMTFEPGAHRFDQIRESPAKPFDRFEDFARIDIR
jgi:hypothetical protein